MCGRFGATFQYRNLQTQWSLTGDIPLFAPRYNIAPSQEVPVIVRREDRNEIRPMIWGLVPSWAQDQTIGQRMINARAETLLEKPAFRQLVATKRCVVPADGFYEWRREGKRKIPIWFQLKNREPFAFPGLWDHWMDRKTGQGLYTFTIITTRPNTLMEPIHDRMPVIYHAAMGRQWLDPRCPVGSSKLLAPILQPLPSEEMEAYEVSPLVNSPSNDTSACVEPVIQARKQLHLL
jgi:putative SOS response-associated peptidase YedK